MSITPTLDNTLGSLLISALFSMALWGVTCSQTYDYFMNNTDRRLQRSIVALLWIIDTFGSMAHSHIAYYILITAFGNPSTIQKSTWSLKALSLITGAPNFIIRSMFARRIYQLCEGNIIIPAWIMSLSTCELGFLSPFSTWLHRLTIFAVTSIVISVKGFTYKDPISVTKYKLSKILYTSVSLGVAADLSVTIALCWLLHSAKSGFQKTNSVVNALMMYTANTGLLVTVVASLGLITYATMKDTLVYVVFFILGAKLYLNAYLATLNARGKLRGTLHSDSSIPISRLGGSGKGGQGVVLASDCQKTGSFPSSTLAISLQKTVERSVDGDSGEGKLSHAV